LPINKKALPMQGCEGRIGEVGLAPCSQSRMLLV